MVRKFLKIISKDFSSMHPLTCIPASHVLATLMERNGSEGIVKRDSEGREECYLVNGDLKVNEVPCCGELFDTLQSKPYTSHIYINV
jgi:hypothetical protein